MENPIWQSLKAWPRHRFPDKYEGFWAAKFAAYPADEVAKAIDALRMTEDPIVPTTDAVEAILERWGVKPEQAKPAAVQNYAKVRAEGEAIDAQHNADNALCDSLNDETLVRLERAAVAAETPEKRAVIGNRPGRRFQSVRSTMAALARREGIVGLVGAR